MTDADRERMAEEISRIPGVGNRHIRFFTNPYAAYDAIVEAIPGTVYPLKGGETMKIPKAKTAHFRIHFRGTVAWPHVTPWELDRWLRVGRPRFGVLKSSPGMGIGPLPNVIGFLYLLPKLAIVLTEPHVRRDNLSNYHAEDGPAVYWLPDG